MNRAVIIFLLFTITARLGAQTQTPGAGAAPANGSLHHEIRRAVNRGADWLLKHQEARGFWSTPDHPALTAFALMALQAEARTPEDPARAAAIRKGYDFLLACVKPDGRITGAKNELANYNTAVSVMGLLAARRADFKPVILQARSYLMGTQIDFGTPGKVDDVFDGGIGYGSKYQHSDMGNTLAALEAIYYSRQLAQDEKPASARDLNWEAAIQFLQNCQNLPGPNRQAWASDDPANKGGFIYYPGHSMAGTNVLANGRVALRSYGSISYGGMLSYAYAQLSKDDPRVRAVFDWLRGNYTLEENPGMGPQGLFYYFHTMAKALNIHGVDVLETKDGRRVHWREELALKLMNLQQSDGSWLNSNARWWEKEPALVTSYAMITLEIVRSRL